MWSSLKSRFRPAVAALLLVLMSALALAGCGNRGEEVIESQGDIVELGQITIDVEERG